jgi:hypothetical protein
VDKPGFKEDFYNTAAGDKYLLYSLDEKSSLKELSMVNKVNGYTLAEIEKYLRSFDEHGTPSTGATGPAGRASPSSGGPSTRPSGS